MKSPDGREELKKAFTSREPFGWDEVDLVLQDIVLDDDSKTADGLELVPHYFEACPQALVFVLTSLDIESLVGSGDVNWKYVDCIISKRTWRPSGTNTGAVSANVSEECSGRIGVRLTTNTAKTDDSCGSCSDLSGNGRSNLIFFGMGKTCRK